MKLKNAARTSARIVYGKITPLLNGSLQHNVALSYIIRKVYVKVVMLRGKRIEERVVEKNVSSIIGWKIVFGAIDLSLEMSKYRR